MAKPKIISPQDAILLLSTEMASGFLEILAAQRKKLTDEQCRQIYTHFLGKVVSGIVFQAVADVPEEIEKASKQEQYEWAHGSYTDAKTRIQDAVAAGFQGAMEIYSGVHTEYYCQVKVVPEPTNKLSN